MLRVRLERYFRTAPRATDVEAEDGDGVVFFFGGFFARVEFAAFVDVFAAGGTFHAEGGHEAHDLLFEAGGFGAAFAFEGRGVEVGGVVFLEDFAFRHGGGSRLGVLVVGGLKRRGVLVMLSS